MTHTTSETKAHTEQQMAPIALYVWAVIIGLLLSLSAVEVVAEQANDAETVVATQPKLAVQLWSVRDSLEKDFKGTIEKIAELGFQGVELAGQFGEYSSNPTGLAEFIESQGMEISGAHVSYEALSDEKFEQTIDFYKRAGVSMLIIAYDTRMGNKDEVEGAVEQLKQLSEKVEQEGLLFGYHNHDFEFAEYKPSDGYPTFWDYLAKSTTKSFVLQMDVGWVNVAGLDPIDFVRRYPGRTITTHYKSKYKSDSASESEPVDLSFTLIGQDGFEWTKLFKVNQTVGGTQWVVLEQEDYPNGLSDIDAVAVSKRGLDEALSSTKGSE